MTKLLEKISSYNLFNYLLPGVVFVVLIEKVTPFSLIQEDIVIGLFVYYFIGLVISRIGSLIVEPFFKKTGFIKFVSYGKYCSASKVNTKIEELSQENNMYRTFCSLFLITILVIIYNILPNRFSFARGWHSEILIVGLFFLFCFAYKKQTSYIVKRVESVVNKGGNSNE